MATSLILLISDAADDLVSAALVRPDHEVTTVADADAGILADANADVVVVDLDGPARRTVDACRAVRESKSLTTVPILAISQTDDVEERIELLEAGVDDVIARPFDARELDARVEALILRVQRSRDVKGGRSESPVITFRDRGERRVVCVFSPKGGVGTTTVAVNIAAALAAANPDQVAIVDLDVQFGQVATHLNVAAQQSIVDLCRDSSALRDAGVLKSFLARHPSGLFVLAAAATPEGADVVTASAVQQILETATRTFTHVVVDAGSELDPRSEAVLTRATDVVIVVTPEFPALKAVHAFREILNASGGQVAETSFVLNNIFAREILKLRDIEEALETKVSMTIPYDAFAFLKGVNEGVPVVIGAPRTAAAEQLSRLAQRLAGTEGQAPAVEHKAKGLGGLFSRG
ncbi:MAG: Response regulatory protein [Chloroflexi bacterium]|nr:Response regulatory protein [Chloroflexota bacterium]